jgi:urease accessory protein UreF
MTVAELVAQLQTMDQTLPVRAFSHYEAVESKVLHEATHEEGFDDIPECVVLHFDV